MVKNNPILKVVVNSLIGLGLVFVWSRFVDLGQILAILKTVNPKFFGLFVFIFLASASLRALRLTWLLPSYRLAWKNMFMLTLLSQFLSFLIPLRVGEISKSVYLHTQYDILLGKSVVWIFIDRFLDFWVLLLFINTLFFLVPTTIPANLLKVSFISFLGFSLLGLFLAKQPKTAMDLAKFLSHFVIIDSIKRYFITFVTTIIEGFAILQISLARLVGITLITILAAVLDGAVWWVVFKSLSVDLNFPKAILGNSLAAMTFLIPAAPGYVGSAEASGLAIFSGIFGIEPNIASAATVLSHMLFLVTLPIVGIASVYGLKFDLSLVWRKIGLRG